MPEALNSPLIPSIYPWNQEHLSFTLSPLSSFDLLITEALSQRHYNLIYPYIF